jgi:hypothetical protein
VFKLWLLSITCNNAFGSVQTRTWTSHMLRCTTDDERNWMLSMTETVK